MGTLLAWLKSLARTRVVGVGVCDDCLHAYCIGMRDLLAGRLVTMVPAIDSDDDPAVYVFGVEIDSDQRALAHHGDAHVRASLAFATCAGVRADLLAVGEIKP